MATMPYFRFTADEYERMIEVGILTKYHHVELIRGEIIMMHPISPPHAFCSMMLTDLLVPSVPDEIRVAARCPIRFSDESIPQPDVALLRFARYTHAYPRAGDVHMMVEIADTTRAYDHEVKLPLYAAAGIPEVWLVDIAADRIERHTEPGADGYQLIRHFGRGTAVESVVIPTLAIPVDEILGSDE
ncbi:MAG: Uma2 family endonuclease [Thermomicrobia bacterium]|nr:Uma2 family endonuclease [Thermomicrobia bacterium]